MLDWRDAMFGHPRGLWGWLGGRLMARGAHQRNQWTAELLELEARQRVLEIGCGPGTLLAALGAEVTALGLDPSRVMLRQAARRNAQRACVKLAAGSALALPVMANSIDRVVAVNTSQLWPDQALAMAEIRRALRPGGQALLLLQPVWAPTALDQLGAELQELLARAGFGEVRQQRRELLPVACLAVSGVAP